ncbi:MAG: glucans biosynthesis glucosyltransferase MdoH [Alphaproteobacteria bacterium]
MLAEDIRSRAARWRGLDQPTLPPDAPLAMPVQRLDLAPDTASHTTPGWMAARRGSLFLVVCAMTGLAAWQMYDVLSVAGLTVLEGMELGLFVLLFGWIALAGASAVFGFGQIVAGGGERLGIDTAAAIPALAGRTAILMPTYNEDPVRVMANLRAIDASLRRAGIADRFHLFILSDTTDATIAVQEEAVYWAQRQIDGNERLFYRRRERNTGRKAGNVAAWVRRFGAAYPLMVVLDADSVMSAPTLAHLVAAMQRNPDIGLLQTVPALAGGRTLLARLQQFAGRLYGPVLAHGLAWWHGGEGNFWGHNAVIRTAAFAAQAGLPTLPGRKPFGGDILSHDFVEAALLRRAGWRVHLVPTLEGSYEQGPPTLVDLTIRDRRWCQGNLQHIAVLPARGLHWVSRTHLLTGIASYLSAPMWLAMLVIGLLIALQARFASPDYFGDERSLFPQWPMQDPVLAAWVFVATMGVLLAPKLLALALALGRRRRRASFGGARRLLCGALAEMVLSALIAPVTMLSQSACVVSTLIGWDSGWKPQRRDEGGLSAGSVVRFYLPHTLVGLVLALAAYLVSLPLFFWMSPVVAGLVLAIPLALVTGQRQVGAAFARAGLLLTPEELNPPAELKRLS